MGDVDVSILLQDYISDHESVYAGSYLVSIVKIVRSWLSNNGKEVKRKIKIRGAEQSPTLRNERIPTQEELITQDELNSLVSACVNARDRVLFSTLYDSGAGIGELLTMKVRDLGFDEYGALPGVTGKTS